MSYIYLKFFPDFKVMGFTEQKPRKLYFDTYYTYDNWPNAHKKCRIWKSHLANYHMYNMYQNIIFRVFIVRPIAPKSGKTINKYKTLCLPDNDVSIIFPESDFKLQSEEKAFKAQFSETLKLVLDDD